MRWAIMLVGHMDEVGGMVSYITKEGKQQLKLEASLNRPRRPSVL